MLKSRRVKVTKDEGQQKTFINPLTGEACTEQEFINATNEMAARQEKNSRNDDPKEVEAAAEQLRKEKEDAAVKAEGVKEPDKEPQTLLLPSDVITQVAMGVIIKKGQQLTLDDIVAKETMGNVNEQFWDHIGQLPWDLIQVQSDPYRIVWKGDEKNPSKKPQLCIQFSGPIIQAIGTIQEAITCLIVYHKHRSWVANNITWVARNCDETIDLLVRLRCILEQLLVSQEESKEE